MNEQSNEQLSTPPRTIRITDELWQAAQLAAAERDESVSQVVRAALVRYVKRGRKA